MNQEHEIVLYQVEDTNIYVNVMFKEDTFWMTQKAMADFFECTTDNISLHLKNIYKEEELDENRRACEKTRVFSCVLLLMIIIIVILHKKGHNSPSPIRMLL